MRSSRQPTAVVIAAAVVIGGLLSGTPSGATRVTAVEPVDIVLDWNAIAIAAIGPGTGLGQPPPLAPIHLAMVQGAVYDAVNAIDGGHEPYLELPDAVAGASESAAAVAAAHGVLTGIVSQSPVPDATRASVQARLNLAYDASLVEIGTSQATTHGIEIGQAAAAAMLAERDGDGRFGSQTFTPGNDIGAWRLVPPLNANVFAWVADVRPFTLRGPDQFRTAGPLPLDSAQYAAEYNEVKSLGVRGQSSRSAEQDALADFVNGNPLPMLNAALRQLASERRLSSADQARLFARTSMATADALIGCWDDKVHWNFWRPQTAIELAAHDGNPATSPQTGWQSRIDTPGYPDHPSGYNCLTAAMMTSARLFFATDKVSFSLTNPATATTRTYERFSRVIDDAIDGRVYAGLHFRTPDVQGAWLGKKAAQWVDRHFFEPVD